MLPDFEFLGPAEPSDAEIAALARLLLAEVDAELVETVATGTYLTPSRTGDPVKATRSIFPNPPAKEFRCEECTKNW